MELQPDNFLLEVCRLLFLGHRKRSSFGADRTAPIGAKSLRDAGALAPSSARLESFAFAPPRKNLL